MRRRRQALHLSRTELARIIEESEFRIGDWERGDHEPRSRAVAKIARALDLSSDYLLDLSEEPGGLGQARS